MDDDAATQARLAERARRADPDRFLCALFAPPARRATLFLLILFHAELARAREMVSEPLLARIRLQWWREVVEGAERRHELATPLSQALRAGLLDRGALAAMIDAREAEAEEEIASLEDWRAYLLGTHGGWAAEAGRILGVDEVPVLASIGAAYGGARLLRATRMLAGQRRCLLPADVLARHDLAASAVIGRPDDPRLRPLLRDLAAQLGGWLPQRKIGGPGRAVELLGVLARRDLRRAELPATARLLGDRLAVVGRAWLAG